MDNEDGREQIIDHEQNTRNGVMIGYQFRGFFLLGGVMAIYMSLVEEIRSLETSVCRFSEIMQEHRRETLRVYLGAKWQRMELQRGMSCQLWQGFPGTMATIQIILPFASLRRRDAGRESQV